MSPTATPESEECKGVIRRDLFRHTSPPIADSSGYRKGRRAVVIDCKIVQVTRGRWEIAYLGAVDFLTGEVLINQFVEPRSRVTSWDTKISGITPSAMAAAIESGEVIRGWIRARWELWQYVDSDTVLIGHSLHNGLDTLGMIHSRVVDSSILTAEAVFHTLGPTEPLPRVWLLKALAGDLLARKIQGGRKGHGMIEDAVTTRDVVIWCLKNPDLLRSWADKTR
ncbi:exonuclease, partial [Aspergillus sclerotiicarbonarius CBS 121057]